MRAAGPAPDLSSPCGGLEKSITFSGAPLDHQQKMRDECNFVARDS
jgi:hypothetical protein